MFFHREMAREDLHYLSPIYVLYIHHTLIHTIFNTFTCVLRFECNNVPSFTNDIRDIRDLVLCSVFFFLTLCTFYLLWVYKFGIWLCHKVCVSCDIWFGITEISRLELCFSFKNFPHHLNVFLSKFNLHYLWTWVTCTVQISLTY